MKTRWLWREVRGALTLYGLWWRRGAFIGVTVLDRSEEWKDAVRCPGCKKERMYGPQA